MKRPHPSLFAIVSLLILLALSVAANLYIAHQEPTISLARGPSHWFTPAHTPPSDLERWPTIPEEIQDAAGPPTHWQRSQGIAHRLYIIEWNAYREDPDPWARLTELRSGFPWTARSSKAVEEGLVSTNNPANTYRMIWPLTQGQFLAPATTYHPLGLILNPIVYALPVWCALLLLRLTHIRLKRKRRTAKGQCPQCAYEVNNLPTCPECGHATAYTQTHKQTKMPNPYP